MVGRRHAYLVLGSACMRIEKGMGRKYFSGITAPTSSVLTQLSTRDPELVPLGIQRPKGQIRALCQWATSAPLCINSSMVECLPSIDKALGLIPSTKKRKI